ncbi:MAG: molybdate ABC transporter substrate-binding protein [Betaproteobacteria bacterium]
MKVIASLPLKAAYDELGLGPAEWVGINDIRRRMLAGEAADAVIGTAALIDELIAAGAVQEGSRADLVKSGAGVAVKKGAPRPDLGSSEALYRALRAAGSIVYSSGPSGVYLAELFKRNGLAEELKGRLRQTPSGTLVGELVARGEADICFQQMSELLQVEGIDVAGPLPPDIQVVTVFSGGVPAKSGDAQGAGALFDFLRSDEAQPVIRRWGMERP